MSGRYFVLCAGNPPSVLTLEPQSREACERAISWQVQGGFPRSDYAVATYDSTADCFRDDAGQEFKPERGPYTEKAWAEFRVALTKKGNRHV